GPPFPPPPITSPPTPPPPPSPFACSSPAAPQPTLRPKTPPPGETAPPPGELQPPSRQAGHPPGQLTTCDAPPTILPRPPHAPRPHHDTSRASTSSQPVVFAAPRTPRTRRTLLDRTETPPAPRLTSIMRRAHTPDRTAITRVRLFEGSRLPDAPHTPDR